MATNGSIFGRPGRLVVGRRIGESVFLDVPLSCGSEFFRLQVNVRLNDISRNQASIAIEAPRLVRVWRSELANTAKTPPGGTQLAEKEAYELLQAICRAIGKDTILRWLSELGAE